MPGELQEIAAELKEEADLHANAEHLSRMREKRRSESGTAIQPDRESDREAR